MNAENNTDATEKEDERQEESFSSLMYSNLRVIIADEQHHFASIMKTLLQSMGFSRITVAVNGDDALKRCTSNKYDIYLFDYNFTSGISGLDLVKKLRREHLAPCMSLMFIVTGDSSRSKVLCAIEHEPDDYVIKPFSQKQFARRLKNAMTKKIALRDVYTCLHHDDTPGAIKALEKALTEDTAYDIYCRCLLAELYGKNGQLELAQTVVQDGMAYSDSDYLKFAMGKILYRMSLYEESINTIKDVLTRQPLMTDAIEYVTKNYVSMGQNDLAIQNIKHAVELSPLSEKLLNTQVTTALNAGDFMTARDGVASLLNIKRNSPDDMNNLLESFVECEFMFVEQSRDPFHISNMEKVMGNMVGRYLNFTNKQTFPVETFKTVCDSRVALIRGDIRKSKKKIYQALELLNKSENASDSIRKGMYLGFMALGEYEMAEHISQQIRHDEPREGAGDIYTNILNVCIAQKNSEQSDRKSRYQELNSQGIGKYKDGKLNEALDLFKEAIRKVPGNSNAILNKIQVLIDMAEIQLKESLSNAKQMAQGLVQECSSDLSLLDGIPLSDVLSERVQLLREDFAIIQKKVSGK